MNLSGQNITMALILSGGFSTWIYVKMMRSTSSDVKTSTIIGAICFGVSFLVVIGVLSMLPDWWNK